MHMQNATWPQAQRQQEHLSTGAAQRGCHVAGGGAPGHGRMEQTRWEKQLYLLGHNRVTGQHTSKHGQQCGPPQGHAGRSRTLCPRQPRSREEGSVSIPPTVSTRSRSWKTARSESGGARGSAGGKRQVRVSSEPPPHATAVREAQTVTDTDTGGGQGG